MHNLSKEGAIEPDYSWRMRALIYVIVNEPVTNPFYDPPLPICLFRISSHEIVIRISRPLKKDVPPLPY